MSDKITLDRETFKVLAADTRVDILKMLGEHKLTLTDISQKTGMSPSTVKEHLERLVEVGLIEQEDRGMKWKYYRLTNKGRNIISPYEMKVWILLGTTLLILAGSLLSLTFKMAFYMQPMAAKAAPQMDVAPAPEMEEPRNQAVEASTAEVSATTTTAPLAREEKAGMKEGDRLLMKGGSAQTGVAEGASKPMQKANMAYARANATTTTVKEEGVEAPKPTDTMATTTIAKRMDNEVPRPTTTTRGASEGKRFGPPYLELILIGLSLAVAGACAGYLLKRRLRVG